MKTTQIKLFVLDRPSKGILTYSLQAPFCSLKNEDNRFRVMGRHFVIEQPVMCCDVSSFFSPSLGYIFSAYLSHRLDYSSANTVS